MPKPTRRASIRRINSSQALSSAWPSGMESPKASGSPGDSAGIGNTSTRRRCAETTEQTRPQSRGMGASEMTLYDILFLGLRREDDGGHPRLQRGTNGFLGLGGSGSALVVKSNGLPGSVRKIPLEPF